MRRATRSVRTLRPHAIILSFVTQAAWAANGCVPGTYEAVPSAGCISASKGYFVPLADATEQTPAPAGTFVNVVGATAPTSASPGYFVPAAGATAPTIAPLGKYVAGTGATAPTIATAGSYVGVTGATTATNASAGYYVPAPGASSQTPAEPGRFVATTGATATTIAGVGTYVGTTGATAATLAPVGTYVASVGASAPTRASPGTYVALPGQAAATDAPPGSYVATTGASESTLASPGYYVPTSGASAQTPAQFGYLASVTGATDEAMLDDGAAGAARSTLAISSDSLVIVSDLTSSRSIAIGGGGATIDTATHTAVLNGVLSGTGSLAKTGAGTLTLGGTNTFSGATTVSAGTLRVNGSIASDPTIAAGATLGGTGTVGSVVVSGTVAPGNSIGTLNVSGSYTANAGSVLEIEVDDAGNSDRVAATGAAALDGTIHYRLAPGSYVAGTTYTVLTAGGGVTGQFSAMAINNGTGLAGFTFTPTYGASTVTATLVEVPFTATASGDTMPLATGLQAIRGTATGDISTVMDAYALVDASQAPRTLSAMDARLSALGGRLEQQMFAGVVGVLRERMSIAARGNDDSSWSMVAATNPGSTPDVTAPLLAGTGTNGRGTWAQLQGVAGEFDTDGTQVGASYRMGAVTVGHDVRIRTDALVGIAVTLTSSSSDYDLSRGSAKGNGARLDLYGEWHPGNWIWQGSVGGGFGKVDQSRRILVGTLDRTATSDFNRVNAGGTLRALRPFAMTGAWTIAPTAGLGLTYARQTGYSETGAGSLDLSVGAMKNYYVTAEAGAEAWSEWQWRRGVIRPRVAFGLRQQWTMGDDVITQSLADVGSFTVPTYGDKVTMAYAQFGLDAEVGRNTRAYASLATHQGSELHDYRLVLGIRTRW